MPMMADLSGDDARRIALGAQGFYDAPKSADRSALTAMLARVKLIQIDSVNVLIRSQYLPVFSRLGPYDRQVLNDAAYGAKSKRLFFEYWAHEASLVPLQSYPLLRWRMERAKKGKGLWGRADRISKKKALVESVYARIEAGATTASSFENARGSGSWWGWSEIKTALEYLFWIGEITSAKRTNSFERVYDLPARVFPKRIYEAPVPTDEEAHRELLRLSLQAMGVATERDLRDYFRLDVADAKKALLQLVDAGEFRRVKVHGWKNDAFVAKRVRIPRDEPQKDALLSPFDSLIWFRDRAHRLFNFHYRIEIYTPAHKRIHGYYVLPFLHNGKLVGRADLKADRAKGKLLVQGRHFEEDAPKSARPALTEQIKSMASWLGLT